MKIPRDIFRTHMPSSCVAAIDNNDNRYEKSDLRSHHVRFFSSVKNHVSDDNIATPLYTSCLSRHFYRSRPPSGDSPMPLRSFHCVPPPHRVRVCVGKYFAKTL